MDIAADRGPTSAHGSRELSSTQVPDFHHRHPFLAVGRAGQPFLAGIGQPPPSLGRRIGGYPSLVGGVVRADVLVVAEQGVPVQEDGVVADVGRGDHRLDLWPHVGVQLQVLLPALGPQPDATGVTLHVKPPASPGPASTGDRVLPSPPSEIELTSEGLSLQVDVDDDGRIAVATISGGGASLRASHYAPALVLQYIPCAFTRHSGSRPVRGVLRNPVSAPP